MSTPPTIEIVVRNFMHNTQHNIDKEQAPWKDHTLVHDMPRTFLLVKIQYMTTNS